METEQKTTAEAKTEQETTEQVPEQNKHVCFRCADFDGYYTKKPSRFERAKQGYCWETHKIKENMESCEQWRSRGGRLHSSKRTSLKVLSELLNDISGIRQILQEAQEEEKETL